MDIVSRINVQVSHFARGCQILLKQTFVREPSVEGLENSHAQIICHATATYIVVIVHSAQPIEVRKRINVLVYNAYQTLSANLESATTVSVLINIAFQNSFNILS